MRLHEIKEKAHDVSRGMNHEAVSVLRVPTTAAVSNTAVEDNPSISSTLADVIEFAPIRVTPWVDTRTFFNEWYPNEQCLNE